MLDTSRPSADPAALMDRMYRRQRHIYDLTRKFYLLGRDRLIDGLTPPSGARVLEIGCGTGRNLVRAALTFPEIRACGIDVSGEMLSTARAQIERSGLSGRITVARGDATDFDPRTLFGVEAFDRIFVSYALSMIPPWREAIGHAGGLLAPGGSLHIVDFGDQSELPAAFRTVLRRWLELFSVHPRVTLEAELIAFARARNLTVDFVPLYRRYAFLAVLGATHLTPATDRASEKARSV
jgi:S-adenosylmethionine-diacylgycerolhomoserine-N-methlytransferase